MNRGEQALVNQRKEDAEKYEPKVVVRFSVFPSVSRFQTVGSFWLLLYFSDFNSDPSCEKLILVPSGNLS